METHENTKLIGSNVSKLKNPNRKKWYIIGGIIALLIIISIGTMIAVNNDLFKSKKDANDKHNYVFGKWPTYGGLSTNTQYSPTNVDITEENINNLIMLCNRESNATQGANIAYTGYITIDNDNNAYVTEKGGNIFKMNIDNCNKIWNVDVANILGFPDEYQIALRQTASLFELKDGTKGVILSAPSNNRAVSLYPANEPCWALALNIIDGSLLWKTNLNINNSTENYLCKGNAFMIDPNDHYAYGGVSTYSSRDSSDSSKIVAIPRGKIYKIDLNNGNIDNVWYPIDNKIYAVNESIMNISNPYIYRGISIWSPVAILDDYIAFGTGNLLSYPDYVESCVVNNGTLSDPNNIDACGNIRDDTYFWKCMEKNIYPSSFIVLNKHNFDIHIAIPMLGIDTEEFQCRNNIMPNCMSIIGPDADVTGAALFKHLNERYAAVAGKSGMFYLINIDTGKPEIIKKIGPWSTSGGNQFGLAVDTKNMIAIVKNSGGTGNSLVYNHLSKTVLLDGTIVCNKTGFITAINITNGQTIWQIHNPWGYTNEQCNNIIYDEYYDITSDVECKMNIIESSNVPVIKPIINDSIIPIFHSGSPYWLQGPTTIANNLIFIPSNSGEIYVHNILNGKYVDTIICPNGIRHPVKGGLTIFEDRLLFYCGPTLYSMKLNQFSE